VEAMAQLQELPANVNASALTGTLAISAKPTLMIVLAPIAAMVPAKT